MWDWQRIASLVVGITIVFIRFESFRRVSDFWGTLLNGMFPVGLAILCIWYADDVDDWFGNPTPFPRSLYQVAGWFVLILYLGINFVHWRTVAPYLISR